jgi:thiol-disulfide isomerase/thioredoxin
LVLPGNQPWRGKRIVLGRKAVVACGMIFVVFVVLVAGMINHRKRQAAMQQSQVELLKTKNGADAESSAASVLGSPDPESDLRGKLAPAFTLVDLSGKKVSLADYKGKPVVIDFWATYCAPCKLEMPWFEEFTSKYKDKGLVVLGIDQDDDAISKDSIAAAAKRTGVTYPILLQDKKIAHTYKLGDYLPQTFFVDKNGTVVDEVIGGRAKDEIEADVKKIAGAE